jgi:hypothetical protein
VPPTRSASASRPSRPRSRTSTAASRLFGISSHDVTLSGDLRVTPRRAALVAVVAVLALPAAVFLEAAAYATSRGASRPCDVTPTGCPPNTITVGLYWGGIVLAALATLILIGVTLWALRRAHRTRGWPGLTMGTSVVVGGAGLALVATRGLSGFCGYPTSICIYPPSTMSAWGEVLLVAAIVALLGSAVGARRRGGPGDPGEP